MNYPVACEYSGLPVMPVCHWPKCSEALFLDLAKLDMTLKREFKSEIHVYLRNIYIFDVLQTYIDYEYIDYRHV